MCRMKQNNAMVDVFGKDDALDINNVIEEYIDGLDSISEKEKAWMKKCVFGKAGMQRTNSEKRMRGVLSHSRQGNITNTVSKVQEKSLFSAMHNVYERLCKKYPQMRFSHEKSIGLIEMHELRRQRDPEMVKRMILPKRKSQRTIPDGGIIYLMREDGTKLPVVFSEKKHQGGFDEHVKVNGRGNALERVYKNVESCKEYCDLLGMGKLLPYVVFGDGNSFKSTSSLMAHMSNSLGRPFNEINTVYGKPSFYFRPNEWEQDEMEEVCFDVAEGMMRELC